MNKYRDFGGDAMGIDSEEFFTKDEIQEFADAVCDKTKEYILKYLDMDLDDFNPEVVDAYTTAKAAQTDIVTVVLDDSEFEVTESIELPFGRWSSSRIPDRYIDKLADLLAQAFGDAWEDYMRSTTGDWGR